MLSWLPSVLKRFSPPKNGEIKRKKNTDVVQSVIRIGSSSFPCEVIGETAEKILINLKHKPTSKIPQKLELRLSGDKTFRWVQLRWHHGEQISVQPITTWAIK
jgi:hypothetical protein